MKLLRADRRRGSERVVRAHPALHEQLQLTHVVAVREHANVASIDDRDAAGERRAPHPLGRGRVRGHRPSARSRRLDDPRQLVDRERWPRLAAGAPAVVRIDLDPVGAIPDLLAHHARERLDAGGLFGALRDASARIEAPRPVAPGGDDGPGHDDPPRSGDDALIDGLLEPDIGGRRALGAEIADGGEAREERVTGVIRGARARRRAPQGARSSRPDQPGRSAVEDRRLEDAGVPAHAVQQNHAVVWCPRCEDQTGVLRSATHYVGKTIVSVRHFTCTRCGHAIS